MEFSAIQIATLLNGKVEGDPNAKVTKLAKIEEGTPGSLTFLSHPKYTEYLKTTGASVIIISDDIEGQKPANSTFIRVKDSRMAFSILMDAYHKQQFSKTGVEQFAVVAPSVKMGTNVYVGSFSYIGENVTLGNNVHIFPG